MTKKSYNNVLRYKDARFILATLLSNPDFACTKLPIKGIYGCFKHAWNGGRTGRNLQEYTTQQNLATYLDRLHRNGVFANWTFTNYFIDVNDKIGNEILEVSSGDVVVITEEALLHYVRKHYPAIKTKASIVKMAKEMPKKRTAEYYNSLLDRFDYIVLHPDDNGDHDLISSIRDISRVEVLANEVCARDCGSRRLHYDIISRENKRDKHTPIKMKETELFRNICPIRIDDSKPLVLTTKDVDILYGLGIRTFKFAQNENARWSPSTGWVQPQMIVNQAGSIGSFGDFLNIAINSESAKQRIFYNLVGLSRNR